MCLLGLVLNIVMFLIYPSNHSNVCRKLACFSSSVTNWTYDHNSQTMQSFNSFFDLDFQIWDSFTVKAQTFKTAIEAACMLLRIDDIVSGIKKKQAPGAQAPSKPSIEQADDADNEQMIPE